MSRDKYEYKLWQVRAIPHLEQLADRLYSISGVYAGCGFEYSIVRSISNLGDLLVKPFPENREDQVVSLIVHPVILESLSKEINSAEQSAREIAGRARA